MDKKTQECIFDPFFTTKGTGQGTGLGLAMVCGFVTSHGGRIACSSDLEKVTTFNIFLPATEQEPKPIKKMGTEKSEGAQRLFYWQMMRSLQARDSFMKDVIYRRWNTDHGGIYVPVTDTTPPKERRCHKVQFSPDLCTISPINSLWIRIQPYDVENIWMRS